MYCTILRAAAAARRAPSPDQERASCPRPTRQPTDEGTRTDGRTDGRIEEGEGRVAPFAARATDRDRASGADADDGLSRRLN